MISRYAKSAYYFAMSPFMQMNAWRHRALWRPRDQIVRVHLGPGQRKYLPGWVNVDANFLTARIDVWADLRNGLPFPDDSVDVFYSHHVIEHLPDSLLSSHFSELFRCLKPGGVIRIGGPHGDNAARMLLECNSEWFDDFPDKRKSPGGRFVNFLLCRGEHLSILTFSYLEELASGAGFQNIRRCQPKAQTHYPHLIDGNVLAMEFEATPVAPHTLIIEAQKPI